jgi:hypothetical protein
MLSAVRLFNRRRKPPPWPAESAFASAPSAAAGWLLQGYTGFLTAPYFQQPEGKADYRGYARRSQAELARLVLGYHRAGYQVGSTAMATPPSTHPVRLLEAQRASPRGHSASHRALPDGARRSARQHAHVGRDPVVFCRPRVLLKPPSRPFRPRAGLAHQPAGIGASRSLRFTVHDDTGHTGKSAATGMGRRESPDGRRPGVRPRAAHPGAGRPEGRHQ